MAKYEVDVRIVHEGHMTVEADSEEDAKARVEALPFDEVLDKMDDSLGGISIEADVLDSQDAAEDPVKQG